MNSSNDSVIDQLEKISNNLHNKLASMLSFSSDGSLSDKLGNETKNIIMNTAKDLFHELLTKEEAIDRVKKSINKVNFSFGNESSDFIYNQLIDQSNLIKEEIKSHKEKQANLDEYDEITISDFEKSRIPWETKDKIFVWGLIAAIFVIFFFEIFTSGEMLKNNFLLFSDKTMWAYSLGVLFGLGGVGIKLWAYAQTKEIQDRVSTASFFVLFLGLITFLISIIFTQFSTSQDVIILDASQILDKPEFPWIAFVLISFSLISFGLLQIFTGVLILKWNKHGSRITKDYEKNKQFKNYGRKISKMINIKHTIENAIGIYFQIIENDRNNESKLDIIAETLLFSRVRKLKDAKDSTDEANKL